MSNPQQLKKAVLLALGKERESALDESILEYIVGVLDDPALRTNVDELDAVLSPLLQGSGAISTDEESKEICQKIIQNISGNFFAFFL